MKKTTFVQGVKKYALLAAGFVLAIGLLGNVQANAASTEVVTEQGTFTIGYGGSGYNKYDAPTVIGYKGSESDVTLPTKVTISGEETDISILGAAFASNPAITSVTVPEGYTSIEGSALSGCGLTSISLPGSLTQVGPSAFSGCTKLTTVTFAENAEGSGLKFMNKVFDGCTALESINLPVQTSSIYSDGNIFTGCTALKTITVSEGNAKYFIDNGSLYAKSEDGTAAGLCTYVGAAGELTLPETVNGLPLTVIGPMVFQKNTALTSVTIPAKVATIDRMAFDGCSSLMTVVLLNENAPTLGSYAFTDMAAGSTIYVPNETVAAAFASPDSWTKYYTSANTTVKVGVPSATTAASVSIKAIDAAEGLVGFEVYLDSAAELNTVMLQLSFDASQVSEGSVTVAEGSVFDNSNILWSEKDGSLKAVLQLGKTGEGNLNFDEPVKLATVVLPLNEGVTGEITATISQAKAAGAGDVGDMVDATITTATATVFIASYDVNGDGAIDLKDIAEAQRYYQAEKSDENWADAKAADVNGDGKVDMEDYIALFHAVLDAMGWL